MSIKQALPVLSNYKEILTQGRNKENKNGGEDYAQISLPDIDRLFKYIDAVFSYYDIEVCFKILKNMTEQIKIVIEIIRLHERKMQ